MVKTLTIEEANTYLNQVGMKTDSWCHVIDHDEVVSKNKIWFNYHAPRSAAELYLFSMHVAGWLTKENWVLLQLDHSTTFSLDEACLFGRLLFGFRGFYDFDKPSGARTFLFEFGKDKELDNMAAFLIANVISTLLLFEHHACLVSSGTVHREAERLGIQDGFLYFHATDEVSIAKARNIISQYEKSPTSYPEWVIDIMKDMRPELF